MKDIKARLKNVPVQAGVYLYKDDQGQVIYVGKAKALRNRMRSYFQAESKMHPKVRAMMRRVADFDIIVTHNEVEALILENNLIKAYHPRYNIHLRDDKTYPYLKISTGERFPRITITREEKDGISRYFGPYTDVTSLRDTLKVLTGIFPLRTCKTMPPKGRPCLNRDIEKCLAPCTGQCSPEEYREVVAALIRFLEGNDREIIEQKETEMKKAAASLEFEKAARLRDQIQSMEIIAHKQKINFDKPYNLDIIALIHHEKQNLAMVFKIRSGKITAKDTFWLNRAIDEDKQEVLAFFLKQYYSEDHDIPGEILLEHLPAETALLQDWLKNETGHKVLIHVPQRGGKKTMLDMVAENARLLWEERTLKEDRNRQALVGLSRHLNLEALPGRLECYDISHLGGDETVAAMVVFTGGEADRKAYRRFKIKVNQNDDFASLAETLRRRFEEAGKGNPSFLPEPDLIVIDGGLGQVNAAAAVLRQRGLDIPVVGLAKKNEELYRPGNSQALVLDRRDAGLMLLQRLRDEAHRFAITYNRQRRSKKLTVSELDAIPGIGAKRKQALLKHFGSVNRLKKASVDEIASIAGLNKKTAAQIFVYFHGNKETQ